MINGASYHIGRILNELFERGYLEPDDQGSFIVTEKAMKELSKPAQEQAKLEFA